MMMFYCKYCNKLHDYYAHVYDEEAKKCYPVCSECFRKEERENEV